MLRPLHALVLSCLCFAIASAQEPGDDLYSPGPEHKILQRLVGQWKGDVTDYTSRGEPASGDATATFEFVLHGRFIRQHFEFETGDHKTTGFEIIGFDRMQAKYVGSRFDSNSTGVLEFKGKWNEKTKVFTLNGESYFHGKPVQWVMHYRLFNKDKIFFSMSLEEEGTLIRRLKLHLTRVK